MTAPQRTASTNAARVFGSSNASAVMVSGRPWSGATVWPTSSSHTTASSSPRRSSSSDCKRHDMGGPGIRLVGGAAGQALLLDIGHGPGRPAHLDNLTRLRQRRQCILQYFNGPRPRPPPVREQPSSSSPPPSLLHRVNPTHR